MLNRNAGEKNDLEKSKVSGVLAAPENIEKKYMRCRANGMREREKGGG